MNWTSCERRHFPLPMPWLRAGDGLFSTNVDQCADCPLMRSKRTRCPLQSLGLPCMQARRSRRVSVAPTIEVAASIKSP